MTRLALPILLVCLAACSKPAPEPEKTSQPAVITSSPSPVTPKVAPPGSAAPEAGEVVWDAPSTWPPLPNPNTMRKATYKVPKAAGDAEDAELSVSAAAGGVQPNIDRWSGQFGKATPKIEKRKSNGLDVTVAEIKGTFASGGMMGAPTTSKEKFMLLGAVVESADRLYFFKLTGPEKTVTAAKKDFDALIASVKAK